MSYLTLIALYSAAQVALGVWIGRRVRTSSDFFVAGRSLGPGLLFFTMLAANIGGGSTVGATGLGYRDGLAAMWWVASAAIGSVVLAFWIGPSVRRLAEAHDLKTVGDLLEFRYGPAVRTAIAALLWLGALFILAGQLIGIAWILNVVVGLPRAAGCALGGLVITIYFTAGGLLTSAWINMVQLVVKLAGFAIALPLAVAGVGGWQALWQLEPSATYWSPWQSGPSGVVYLAMLGPAFIISPGLLQKIYGARDDRAVRIGVGLNALGLALYAMVPVLLGMAARVRFPQLADHELALPMILMNGVPAAVGAIGLAAVFSAEVSAADAVLFMLTTSLAQDFYKRFVNREATDAALLRVTRVTAVGAGALGIGVSMVLVKSVVDALSIFYTIMAVGLFVPVIAGLYYRRATSAGALAAIVSGTAVVAVMQLVHAGARWHGLTPAMAGLLAALAAFLIAQLANRRGTGA